MKLEGDVAIVTGGASGIGRAIATLFASEGAKVVVADLQKTSCFDEETPSDVLEVIQMVGGEGMFVKTDVSDGKMVKDLVNKTLETFGQVNILVNVAGVFVRNSIVDVSDEEWERVININLRGYFYTCREIIPIMLKQGEGRIINMSSIHGLRGTGGALTYCASKGGIENMTKQLAMEYAPHNIRVNAIAPGTTRTAMCKPFLDTPEYLAEYKRRTLYPRLGIPEDSAYAALYLASKESSFVVGHTLVIDGGWIIT